MLKKFLLLAIGCALLAPSYAQTDDTPTQKLEATINSVLDTLFLEDAEEDLVAKRDKILHTLEQSFSFDVIIRRALGRNWQKLNDEQQKAFTTLATDIIIRAYTKEFKNAARPSTTFKKPVTLSKSKIEIPTVVLFNGKTINLSYRLANIKGSGWQVYDILVEGISLVANYRKQFDEHFQKQDAASLIAKLQNMLKEN